MYLDDINGAYYLELVNDFFSVVHRESDGLENIADEDGRILFDDWMDSIQEGEEEGLTFTLSGESYTLPVASLVSLSAEERLRNQSEEELLGLFGCTEDFIDRVSRRHDQWVEKRLAEGWLPTENKEGRLRIGLEALHPVPARDPRSGETVMRIPLVRNVYGNAVGFVHDGVPVEIRTADLTDTSVILTVSRPDGVSLEIPFGELDESQKESVLAALSHNVRHSDRLHSWKTSNALQRKLILLEAVRQHMELRRMIKNGEWRLLTQSEKRLFRDEKLWEFLSPKERLALQLFHPELEVYTSREAWQAAQREFLGRILEGMPFDRQREVVREALGQDPVLMLREAVGMSQAEKRLYELGELMRLEEGKMGHFELLALKQEFDRALRDFRAEGKFLAEGPVESYRKRLDKMLDESLKELQAWKKRQGRPLIVQLFSREQVKYKYPIPPKEVLNDKEVREYIDGKRKTLDMRTKPMLVALFKYELLKRVYTELVKRSANVASMKEQQKQASMDGQSRQQTPNQARRQEGGMKLSELRLSSIQGDMMRIVSGMSLSLIGAAMRISQVATSHENPRSINPAGKNPAMERIERRADLVKRQTEQMRKVFSGLGLDVKVEGTGMKLSRN